MPTHDCSRDVISAAIKVHSILGPGLLEAAYKRCLTHELRKRGLLVEEELELPVMYDGICVELAYRIDLLVNGSVIVEVKAVAKLLPFITPSCCPTYHSAATKLDCSPISTFDICERALVER